MTNPTKATKGVIVTLGLAALLALAATAAAQDDAMMDDEKMDDGMMDDGMMDEEAKDNPGPFVGIVVGVFGLLMLARRHRARSA